MSKGTYWFWTDWLGDQAVRRLTPAERGVWIDLIALAAVGNPVGYVCDEHGRKLSEAEIARVTNAGTVEEVTTLINGILEKGAASRDRTGRLFFRQLINDGTQPKRPPTSEWAKLRVAVFERDGFKCVYCGVAEAQLECDHVIPISRGGSNKMRNLATACRPCNQAKRDLRPEEWLQ